jgi:hypothetical protein
MTTRSETQGSGSSPYFNVRSSTGTDGRYETVGGSKREKWNGYSLSIRDERAKFGRTMWPPQLGVAPPYSTMFSSNDQLRLLSKLASKVKGSDFNLAVNVAQGKQTVGMVVDCLKAFGLAALDAKRGNFTSAIRRLSANPGKKSKFTTKDISSRWLELQYGWLPLISDSYEALLAYQDQTDVRRIRIATSISVHGKWEASASPTLLAGPGLYTGSRRIIAELTENLSTPRILGLTDPLSVVWEVIPWSFVIDWFLPIGSYLDNLNVIPKLNGRFLSTDFIRGSELGKLTPGENVPASPYYGGFRTVKYTRVIRTVSTSLSVPRPSVVSLPDAMSPKRIYNAMALAHQRFRSVGL